jgi:rod shape-determining protein MreC
MIQRRVPSFATAVTIIGIVACTAVLVRFFHLSDPVVSRISTVLSPIQSRLYRITHKTSSTDRAVSDLSKAELITRYDELNAQYRDLNATVAQLRVSIEEQKLSGDQFSYLESRSFQGISAQVTGRSISDAISTITLNRGSQHGVKSGQPVIVENGSLVGTIRSVQDRSSLVQLITSPESKISATVQNEKKSPGILSGDFNLALYVDYIPQFDPVTIGQIVATSGQDANIPSGLPIGTVKEVTGAGTSLFQRAVITPLADGEKVSVVTIITQ